MEGKRSRKGQTLPTSLLRRIMCCYCLEIHNQYIIVRLNDTFHKTCAFTALHILLLLKNWLNILLTSFPLNRFVKHLSFFSGEFNQKPVYLWCGRDKCKYYNAPVHFCTHFWFSWNIFNLLFAFKDCPWIDFRIFLKKI